MLLIFGLLMFASLILFCLVMAATRAIYDFKRRGDRQ